MVAKKDQSVRPSTRKSSIKKDYFTQDSTQKTGFPRSKLWSWNNKTVQSSDHLQVSLDTFSSNAHVSTKTPIPPDNSKSANLSYLSNKSRKGANFGKSASMASPRADYSLKLKSKRKLKIVSSKGWKSLSTSYKVIAQKLDSERRPSIAEQSSLKDMTLADTMTHEEFLNEIDTDPSIKDDNSSFEKDCEQIIIENYLVKESREKFWNRYRNSEHKDRPESSRGRYIKGCDKNGLLPLPVLDLSSRSHAFSQRYNLQSKELNYNNYYFGNARIKAFSSSIETLPVSIEKLSMENSGMLDIGSAALVNSLRCADSNITKLDLARNRIGEKGSLELVLLLKSQSIFTNQQKFNSITLLNLSHNKLGDKCVSHILDALLDISEEVLEDLNLAGNLINHSANKIASLISKKTSKIKSIDLSWNSIRGEASYLIASAIEGSCTIRSLNLSDNNFGNQNSIPSSNGNSKLKNDMKFLEIAKMLASSSSVENINLSNNQISETFAYVFIDTLYDNISLSHVVLGGNNIGSIGANAIVQGIASCRLKPYIDIRMCNFMTVEENNILDKFLNSDIITLNLQNLFELAIAKDILYRFNHKKIVIKSIKSCGSTLFSKRGNDEIPDVLQVEQFISHALLHIEIMPVEGNITPEIVPSKGFATFIDLLGKIVVNSEVSGIELVKQLSVQYFFSKSQVERIIAEFSKINKVEIAVLLLPLLHEDSKQFPRKETKFYDLTKMIPDTFFDSKELLIDKDSAIESLTYKEKVKINEKLGKWARFDTKNSLGSYHLNLSYNIDRQILRKLMEASAEDKKYRVKQKLQDVSQYGDYSCFRNVEFNHQKIMMLPGWSIPRKGIVSFDFVPTRHSFESCNALNDTSFEKMLKELKQLKVKSNIKFDKLHQLSGKYYFTARQIHRIIEIFKPLEQIAADDSVFLNGKSQTTKSYIRVEILILFFNRIVDPVNMDVVLKDFDLNSRTSINNRIGIINLFNPMQPSGIYRINFDVWEEKQLLVMLLQLSLADEGKLIQNKLDNQKLDDIPESWFTSASSGNDSLFPSSGLFKCNFVATNRVSSIHELRKNSTLRDIVISLSYTSRDHDN